MVISENLQNLKGLNWKIPKIQSVGGNLILRGSNGPRKIRWSMKVNESQSSQSKDELVNEGFDQFDLSSWSDLVERWIRLKDILRGFPQISGILRSRSFKYLVSFDPDMDPSTQSWSFETPFHLSKGHWSFETVRLSRSEYKKWSSSSFQHNFSNFIITKPLIIPKLCQNQNKT